MVVKWVTRAHVHIDRVACPWLIKRFIDTDAEFLFVAKEHVGEIAKSEKAIPFDVPDVELGHHGENCSFIAFLEKYHLTEAALQKMGELVNAADTSDFKSHPFASCLDALSQGFSLMLPDDLENIEQQFNLYDALYNYFRIERKKENISTSTKKKTEPTLLFSLNSDIETEESI